MPSTTAPPPPLSSAALTLLGPCHRQTRAMLRRLSEFSDDDRRRLVLAQSRRRSADKPREFARQWQGAQRRAADCAQRHGRAAMIRRVWVTAQRIVHEQCHHESAWTQEMLFAAVAGETYVCVLADVIAPGDANTLHAPWYEAIQAPALQAAARRPRRA